MAPLPGLPPKPPFNAAQFAYSGSYDHVRFLAEFHQRFATRGMADTTDADVLALLGFIETDTDIADLRWTAYLLATGFWEGRSLTKEAQVVHDKHGKPRVDRSGKTMTRTVHKWRVMQPTEEIGHGRHRAYHEPVKTVLQTDGTILVTEHDGDQFTVNVAGHYKPMGKARRGAVDGGPPAKTYLHAKGGEHSYFGRGYVQLTWWDNYLRASVELGRTTEFLMDPDRVEDPATAYKIMSHGMRTGTIFANGRKLADYFTGTRSDYVGARAMVNGVDHNDEIAAIAEKFEAALLASRVGAVLPVPAPPPLPGVRLP